MKKKPIDLTVQILRQIRDEIVSTRDSLGARIDQTNARLDQTNARLDHANERLDGLHLGMKELAEQQRFVVRGVHSLAKRDHRFETELDDLRTRVETLERRADG
jgi:chromosome segregation ATPase